MMDFLSSFGVQLFMALILDMTFGEFRRWHLLVGFGQLAKWIEARFYPQKKTEFYKHHFTLGCLAVAILLAPLIFLGWVLASIPVFGWWFDVFILYLALGGNSLTEHGRDISHALFQGNLSTARKKVGWIVSRETQHLSKKQVIRATIESILENGNDAVFGALFWFLLAGAPGVILYRLSNTLDAMWGYKNERYLFFGRGAARLDDLLNWIPARLTAITYGIQGNWREALHCWLSQSRDYKSPNGGVVMAAGAGSLGFLLGGTAIYHGKQVVTPTLGTGCEPETWDIERSIRLVFRGSWYWAGIGLIVAVFV